MAKKKSPRKRKKSLSQKAILQILILTTALLNLIAALIEMIKKLLE